MRAPACIALALLVATPAAAHLAHRGTPLSELAASSPAVVAARVVSADEAGAAVVVEEAWVGGVEAGPLSFRHAGHHAPRYEAGARVLVFLSGGPPWTSHQGALDGVDLPADDAERAALRAAVRGFAALRALPTADQRLAQLKRLSLAHLESPSPRLRGEALLDLVAIAGRSSFAPDEIETLARLAGGEDTPETLAPGLVVLLAMIRTPAADRALFAVLASAGGNQARARAAQVIANRHGARALDALRAVADDPAPAVRATARQALARLAPAPQPQRSQ